MTKGGPSADDFSFEFKAEIFFGIAYCILNINYIERRIVESQNLLSKHPGKVPIVIEKSLSEINLPDLEQTKYEALLIYHLLGF